MNTWRPEGFQADETALHDTVVVAACHYTFVWTCSVHNTESES